MAMAVPVLVPMSVVAVLSRTSHAFVRLRAGSRACFSISRRGVGVGVGTGFCHPVNSSSSSLTASLSLKKKEKNNETNCVQSLGLFRRTLNKNQTGLLCQPRNTRNQSTSSTSSSSSTSASSVHKPSHPNLIRVVHSPHAYASWAESLVNLPAGAHFASFEDARPVTLRRYSTVQVGFGPAVSADGSSSSSSSSDVHAEHIELNSDLRFANHSCNPSLVFDTAKMEARVVDDRPLRVGDELTFFYPSTEWEMDRPFECHCCGGRVAGERVCKGWIAGAKGLSETALEGYWINGHIRKMVEKRGRK